MGLLRDLRTGGWGETKKKEEQKKTKKNIRKAEVVTLMGMDGEKGFRLSHASLGDD